MMVPWSSVESNDDMTVGSSLYLAHSGNTDFSIMMLPLKISIRPLKREKGTPGIIENYMYHL
jgi:hypothetical protein